MTVSFTPEFNFAPTEEEHGLINKTIKQKQDSFVQEWPTLETKKTTQSLYLCYLFYTEGDKDDIKKYVYYDTRVLTNPSDLVNIVDSYTEYAKNRLKKGDWSGYYINCFAHTPLQPSIAPNYLLDYSVHEFLAKKKTYLNGPNKDNEFLKKKGKHFV